MSISIYYEIFHIFHTKLSQSDAYFILAAHLNSQLATFQVFKSHLRLVATIHTYNHLPLSLTCERKSSFSILYPSRPASGPFLSTWVLILSQKSSIWSRNHHWGPTHCWVFMLTYKDEKINKTQILTSRSSHLGGKWRHIQENLLKALHTDTHKRLLRKDILGFQEAFANMGHLCWVLRDGEKLWKGRERCFSHREKHIQDKTRWSACV